MAIRNFMIILFMITHHLSKIESHTLLDTDTATPTYYIHSSSPRKIINTTPTWTIGTGLMLNYHSTIGQNCFWRSISLIFMILCSHFSRNISNLPIHKILAKISLENAGAFTGHNALSDRISPHFALIRMRCNQININAKLNFRNTKMQLITTPKS